MSIQGCTTRVLRTFHIVPVPWEGGFRVLSCNDNFSSCEQGILSHVDKNESLTCIEHIIVAGDEGSFVRFSGPLVLQKKSRSAPSFCSGNRNVERRELFLPIQSFMDLEAVSV